MSQTITVEMMKNRLFSVDQLVRRLEATEPLVEYKISPKGKTPPQWLITDTAMEQAQTASSTDLLEASVLLQTSDGIKQLALTKDALMEATSFIGLPRGYVARCPAELIQPQLNYWYSHYDKDVKLLTANDQLMAVTRATVNPYSNLRLLDQVLEGIQAKYGCGPEDLYVDYKLTHDLRKTHIRIIIPEVQRRIASKRDSDEKPDVWSVGVQLLNSLIGEHPTSLSGYEFAWWCTNGATSEINQSGSWSRRGVDDDVNVYSWARDAVDEILGGLEDEFDVLQALTDIELTDEVGQTLQDVFELYRVPSAARADILSNMVESEDTTAYGIHAAITAAANSSDLSADAVTHLLDIGGAYPRAITSRCGACHRVHPLGHSAHSHN